VFDHSDKGKLKFKVIMPNNVHCYLKRGVVKETKSFIYYTFFIIHIASKHRPSLRPFFLPKESEVILMLTPYVVVDMDNLERNIKTMADITSKLGIKLRPHFKTHKSPLIAWKQISDGAIGITCATLGEAEIAVKSGLTDILISREIMGTGKLPLLVGLTRHADLKVVVDDPLQVEQLGTAFLESPVKLGVLIEINIGQNRCGMDPGNLSAIIAMVKKIDSHPQLNFLGFQGYEGHLVLHPSEEERTAQVQRANSLLMKVVKAVEETGYPSDIVTGGGTGTTMITGSIKGMTEIQPGTYATMDAAYSKVMGHLFSPAVKIVTTVISKPSAERLIVDAGSKAISTDYGPPEVIGHSNWVYKCGGDEYGILSHANGQAISGDIGDEISLYPSHGCTTFNLYDAIYGFRNGVLEIEIPIAGRGKSF
jgi:Predicted amino acid aldolase or racemase